MNEELCDHEEQFVRLTFCKDCENFKMENDTTTCTACNCSISLLIIAKLQPCPKGNW